MRKIAPLVAVLAASMPLLSHAGPCDSIEAADRLAECLGGEYSKADAQLNAEYTRLRARLDPNRKAQLTQAQRAWLAYRDKDCEFEASAADGGQAYQPLYVSCQIRKTMRRIQDLKGEGN